MKLADAVSIGRGEAVGFIAALLLHSLVLCGIWRYHVIPLPPEDRIVYVSLINPATPAKIADQAESQPAPVSRETPKPVAAQSAPVSRELLKPVPPVTPQRQVGAAQVTPLAEQAASSVPVVKANAAPALVSAPSVSRPVGGAQSIAAVMPPVLQKDELSVSCTERTPPAYPKLSARRGEQGKTVLLVELDERGRVAKVDVKMTSGFPRLDEAAVNAVKSWRCSPARRNGAAVRSVASQPFAFTLKGR
jgi:protein TonB